MSVSKTRESEGEGEMNFQHLDSISSLSEDFDCFMEIYESDLSNFQKVKEINGDVQRHHFYLNKRFHFRFQQAQEVLTKSRLLIERHRSFFSNVPDSFESISNTIKKIIETDDSKLVSQDGDTVEENENESPGSERNRSLVSDFSEFQANLKEYYDRVETDLIRDYQSFQTYVEKVYPHRVVSYRSSLQDIHSQVKEMRDQFEVFTNNSHLILEDIETKVEYQKQLVTDLRQLLDRKREEGLLDPDDEEVEDEGEDNDEADEYSLLLLGGTYGRSESTSMTDFEEEEINFRILIRTKHNEIQALSSRLTLDGSVFIQKYLRPQESLLHDLQHSVCEFTDSLEPYFEIPYHMKFFVSIKSVYETVLDERKRRETFVKEYQEYLLERHQIEEDCDRNHLWSVFVPLLRIPSEVIISTKDQLGMMNGQNHTDQINSPTGNGRREEEEEDDNHYNDTEDEVKTEITSTSTQYISTSEDGHSNVSSNQPNQKQNQHNHHHRNRKRKSKYYLSSSPPPVPITQQNTQNNHQQATRIIIHPSANISDFNPSETESDVVSVSDIETYMTAILTKKRREVSVQTLPDISRTSKSLKSFVQIQTKRNAELTRPSLIWEGQWEGQDLGRTEDSEDSDDVAKKMKGGRRKSEQKEKEKEKGRGYNQTQIRDEEIILTKMEQEEEEMVQWELRRDNSRLIRENEILGQKVRDKDDEKKRHLYHLSRISTENMKLRRNLNKMSNSENLHLVQLKKKVFLLQKRIRELLTTHSSTNSSNINHRLPGHPNGPAESGPSSVGGAVMGGRQGMGMRQPQPKVIGKLEIGDLIMVKKCSGDQWKVIWEQESEDEDDEYFVDGSSLGIMGNSRKILYGIIGEIYAKKVPNFEELKKKNQKQKRFVKEIRIEKVIIP